MTIRNLLLCLVAVSLLFVAACGDTAEQAQQGEKETMESKEVVVDRAAVEQEYHEQLAAMEEKLANIKSEMAEASDEVAATYEAQVQELEQSVADIKGKLDNIGAAAEDSWESLKTELDQGIESLGNSLEEVKTNLEKDMQS